MRHTPSRYKSILDLLGKKADHSVLRLLQISQQHIESQLERVRHERELWKEVRRGTGKDDRRVSDSRVAIRGGRWY